MEYETLTTVKKESNKIRKQTFSQMKNNNQEKFLGKNDVDLKVKNRKLMVEILNHSDIKDTLNDFIFKENNDKQTTPLDTSFSNNFNFDKTLYSSKDAFQVFYEKFHKFDELNRKGTLDLTTPTMSFINATKKEKIFPNPVGIIKRKGDENKLFLNNHRLGDSYVQALSSSLKYTEHLNEIHLGNNRLTGNSVIPLLVTIKDNLRLYKRIEILDLSYNMLNNEAIGKICIFLNDPACEVRELNLEGNNLGDYNTNLICENIIPYLSEKMNLLNFSKNQISNKGVAGIAQVCGACVNLKVLVIAWNDITNYSAHLILKQFKKHSEIRILDLSWNNIGNTLTDYGSCNTPGFIQDKNDKGKNNAKAGNNGSKKEVEKKKKDDKDIKRPEELNKDLFFTIKTFKHPKKFLTPMNQSSNVPSLNTIFDLESKGGISLFATELGECFQEGNFQLVHLDISHNNLSLADTKYLCIFNLKLAETVKSNHTILGIHVDGNEMTIDSLGFIYPLDKFGKSENYYANSQIYSKIEKKPNLKSKVYSIRKIRAKNNCWICEGWHETQFKFIIPENYLSPNPGKKDEVKIHFCFDDFKPTDMIFRVDKNMYICNRMCPPGEIEYFYTLNNEITYYPTHNSKIVSLNEPFSIFLTVKDEEDEDVSVEKKIFSLHKTNISFWGNNIDGSYISSLKYCVPRPEKLKEINIRPRTPWIFPISIWAAYDYSYEGDSEEYLDDVFEHDFNRISKKRDGKVDEEVIECRKILRTHFRKIIDTYKNYSSLSNSSIWQFSQSGLLEFCSNCPGLIDSQFNTDFILLKETEVKAIDKEEKKKTNNKNIPDNLIRHQFMNLLVKVAKDKYIRTKLKQNLLEALTDSFNQHYLSALIFENHNWRMERYYNEPVDNLLKAHLPIFNAIYYTFAQKKDPSKKDTWMILDEFNSMCLEIVDNEFPVRDIPLFYNYSMKLQINEINSDRHYNMLFPEFLEAFCRVIDKFSPIPLDQNKDEWTRQKREEQHLSVKLENILPLLPKLIRNPEYKLVKEKFYLPGKEEDTGLFKIDLTNQFYNQVQNLPKKIYVEKKTKKRNNNNINPNNSVISTISSTPKNVVLTTLSSI